MKNCILILAFIAVSLTASPLQNPRVALSEQQITLSLASGAYRVTLEDMRGRTIVSRDYNGGGGEVVLPFGTVGQGIYMLTVRSMASGRMQSFPLRLPPGN